ncbi:hypothetical protein V9T40_012241 [Parthenolecanium corni]|uniref:Uncharacterized protein n=1 Tax=Parthenolecanium corni TaxID=536013 RepID=A0AAN9Y094_9HEMI
MAFNRLSVIKIIEFILVLLCVFFHYHSMEGGNKGQLFFVSAVFGGYLIIMIGLLLGFFVDTAFGRRVDMYFSVFGGVLFLAAAYFCYDEFNGRLIQTEATKYGHWKTWTALVEGILFLVDGVFTFRLE